MFPTSSCYFGVASKDQVVSYDQETNAISETSRYSQDVLNEVLQHKKMVKYITLRVVGKLNSRNSVHPHPFRHNLHQICDYQRNDQESPPISSFFVSQKIENNIVIVIMLFSSNPFQ